MQNGQFLVTMLIEGRQAREFEHCGRVYVVAVGERYFVLHCENKSASRVEVQASVDGLSVMNGKLAGTTNTAGGYIVEPNGYVDIPGYRLDDTTVAGFRFGGVEQSYARRIDAPTQVGVIGIRVYAERPHIPDFDRSGGYDTMRGGDSLTMGGMKGLGTAFGERKEHRVTRVSFERGRLAAELVFEYNNETGFKAAGIIIPPEPVSPPVKTAFPGDAQTGCTPPPGWKSMHKPTR